MLWHHSAWVNSHQRWKQARIRVCFHLWCELTSTMNVTEWQVSWNSRWERLVSKYHSVVVNIMGWKQVWWFAVAERMSNNRGTSRLPILQTESLWWKDNCCNGKTMRNLWLKSEEVDESRSAKFYFILTQVCYYFPKFFFFSASIKHFS